MKAAFRGAEELIGGGSVGRRQVDQFWSAVKANLAHPTSESLRCISDALHQGVPAALGDGARFPTRRTITDLAIARLWIGEQRTEFIHASFRSKSPVYWVVTGFLF